MTSAPLGSVACEKRESSSRMGDSGAHGSGWYGCWYTGAFGGGASKGTRPRRDPEEQREDVRDRFLGGDETLAGEAGGLGCGVEAQEGGGGGGDAGLADRRQGLGREETGFC